MRNERMRLAYARQELEESIEKAKQYRASEDVIGHARACGRLEGTMQGLIVQIDSWLAEDWDTIITREA